MHLQGGDKIATCGLQAQKTQVKKMGSKAVQGLPCKDYITHYSPIYLVLIVATGWKAWVWLVAQGGLWNKASKRVGRGT